MKFSIDIYTHWTISTCIMQLPVRIQKKTNNIHRAWGKYYLHVNEHATLLSIKNTGTKTTSKARSTDENNIVFSLLSLLLFYRSLAIKKKFDSSTAQNILFITSILYTCCRVFWNKYCLLNSMTAENSQKIMQ